jgi:hypothetical protein
LFYRWARDLHLYFGLFISPFVLLFAASVFFLNHAKVAPDKWSSVETFQNVEIPDAIDRAQGKDAIARAQAILQQVGVTGEIGFTRFVRQTHHFVFPVSKPGVEANVDVDLDGRTATVSRRPTSVWEAFAYLHKMPGPHNVAIRGNWRATRVWRWFADATIYLILFISISGIYLWWTLKAERRIGAALLSAGILTFFGLIYAVIR